MCADFQALGRRAHSSTGIHSSRAFSDHDLIRTVVRRGYQFTGEIHTRPADQSERPDSTPGRNVPRPPRSATNLPAPTSDLIGRDAEIGEVIGHVVDHRFVALTGTGGIGKTQLALGSSRPGISAIDHFARVQARCGHGPASAERGASQMSANCPSAKPNQP
jgi:hypothetical protein